MVAGVLAVPDRAGQTLRDGFVRGAAAPGQERMMGTSHGSMAMSAAERAAAAAVTKRLARLLHRPESDPEVIRWARLLSRTALRAGDAERAGDVPAATTAGP
jgi:hypothetical protein